MTNIRTISSSLLFGTMLVVFWTPVLAAQEAPAAASSTASGGLIPRITVAEAPPGVPHVSCSGGQLSISAANSTLESVIAALQVCVVEKITLPESAVYGRSWISLGPGPLREIMDQLFSSTDLNYVLDPSVTSDKMQSILLMTRSLDDPGKRDLHAVITSRDRINTPAQAAWLASRNSLIEANAWDRAQELRAADSDIAATSDSASAPAPVPPAAPAISSPTPTAQATATDRQNVSLSAPQNEMQSNPAVEDSPSAATVEPQAKSPAEQVLQNKITSMQQLFEQRRKMTAESTAATPPSASN